MKEKEPLRFEDAAVPVTVSGWGCKQCRRFWGSNERGARTCCATDLPCACGGRNTNRLYTVCDTCRKRHNHEREEEFWAKLEKVAWDGATPLCLFDGDKFFFTLEDLREWFYIEQRDEGLTLADVRLVVCRRVQHRACDVTRFLDDDIPEDFARPDFREIEKTVDDWISANVPPLWEPGGQALTPESLRECLGDLEAEAVQPDHVVEGQT